MKRLLLEKNLCVSRVAINANFSKASVPLLPPVLVVAALSPKPTGHVGAHAE